jgi:2-keto-4-pentenoate hydratase/2-oxohepta-3-ene-1,7-dioic acid hydratase in catechol pathway
MKIICVGRNYAAHAAELKNEVPKEPVIFLKPETAVVLPRMPFFIPDFSKAIHYELELVVRISRLGKNIEPRFAHKYYNEVTAGIDFTARDVQDRLKNAGLPWEKAKAFDGSAVVGTWVSKDQIKTPDNIHFSLKKNGAEVQVGSSALMLFSIDDLIAHISTFFTLKIGDLIFTGTPSGVGPVAPNDLLEGFLEGVPVFKTTVK